MSGYRVLLTNAIMRDRTGAELYVHDVALGLLARGHSPIVYSHVLGPLADRLRDATIPVVDNLQALVNPPDVIHSQGNLEGLIALLQFPDVPAVRVCHGWADDAPVRFRRVLRYVAVDETTRDRLIGEWRVPAQQVKVLLNFVDLTRFHPRPPLPQKPRRALVFSNYARAHVEWVRRACATFDIEVDAIGSSVGAESQAPEDLLGGYDLVFAKGRCAIEALAIGTAVILCDASGIGPLVSTHNFADLRRLNFGLRALREPLGIESLGVEIARYDAADAGEVSRQLREVGSAEVGIDRLVEVYERVMAEWRDHPRHDADSEQQVVRPICASWRRGCRGSRAPARSSMPGRGACISVGNACRCSGRFFLAARPRSDGRNVCVDLEIARCVRRG